MSNRKAEDYPQAYEDSLDAKAIDRMLSRFKQSIRGLQHAQAVATIDLITGMLRRGEWLAERDAMEGDSPSKS